MMNNRKLISLLVCVLLFNGIFAQLPMGQWQTHFSYGEVSGIASSPDNVYALSNGALFAVNKEYQNIEFYSKISGLSDVNIAHIAYSDKIKALLVLYENANIDLLYDDGEVENIPDISRKNMAYNKKVNNVYFKDDEAFLCTDFGIVVLNLKRKEITETYFIGSGGSAVSVNSCCYWNGTYFATTEEKLYKADKNSLLVNFENWQEDTSVSSGAKKSVFVFADSVWLLKNDSTLYCYVGQEWQPRTSFGSVGNVRISDNSLLITSRYNVLKRIDTSFSVEEVGIFRANDMIYDKQNTTYWLAVNANVYEYNFSTKKISSYKPNGPMTNYNYEMQVNDGCLYVLSGARWQDYGRMGYIDKYENGEWTCITPVDMKTVPQNTSVLTELYPKGLVDMTFDKNDPKHFFVASWGLGLYEFRNNELYKLYNADNPIIESALPDKYPETGFYYYTRIGAMAFDANGILWFANDYATNTLKYITPDGVVKNYTSSLETLSTQKILVSNQNPNQKWVLVSRDSQGASCLFVFDDGGTPDNKADDKQRMFTSFVDQDGKVLTPGFTWTMTQDHDGTIWIGTLSGLILAKNPETIFNQNYNFEQIKIPRNDGTDEADYLLDNESINDIEVDGINRKWIATASSGVFLVSADGTETIEHFTTENSPLPSNTVLSIAINQKSGEVFFGTDNSIISYQSDTAEGAESFSDIRAYPNPVREDFTGLITIAGLVENTTVKITDMAGNVVYATTSKGSLATWDGTTTDGKRVSSGVYFAVCTTSNKKVYARTKLLVLK